MAVYRIGDVLRMKREALGITREKLCEMSGDICSVQTLYRMESGKVKVKQEVYRKLMECMGELPERRYASIVVSEYQTLNLKPEIQAHLFHGEFKLAEEKLKRLEMGMNVAYVRNMQYLSEMKTKLKFQKQQISYEEYLKMLWEALVFTIPRLNRIDIADWPYNREEFAILAKIAENKEDMLLKLMKNVERKYMEEDYYTAWHTYLLCMLSTINCNRSCHEKSIELCKIGMEESKGRRLIGNVSDFLYDVAWNKEQMKRKEILTEKERAICKKLLVQAYYLSAAQNDEQNMKRIKRLWNRSYSDDVKMI